MPLFSSFVGFLVLSPLTDRYYANCFGRLPTRSAAVKGVPDTGLPRLLLLIGIGFPWKSSRACGPLLTFEKSVIVFQSLLWAYPGSLSCGAVAAAGAAFRVPFTSSYAQMASQPAHLIFPLKFQKVKGSR